MPAPAEPAPAYKSLQNIKSPPVYRGDLISKLEQMCLNTRLKNPTDGFCLMFSGRLFHSIGTAAASKRSTFWRCQLVIFCGSQSVHWGVQSQQFM